MIEHTHNRDSGIECQLIILCIAICDARTIDVREWKQCTESSGKRYINTVASSTAECRTRLPRQPWRRPRRSCATSRWHSGKQSCPISSITYLQDFWLCCASQFSVPIALIVTNCRMVRAFKINKFNKWKGPLTQSYCRAWWNYKITTEKFWHKKVQKQDTASATAIQ